MDTSFGALLLISTRFTLVISPHKISSQVYYFGSLVCVHQLNHQNLKFSVSLVHSRNSRQTLLAKPMVFPGQAVSVLEELVTRSEGRLSPLVLQPWIIHWGGSTCHISQDQKEKEGERSDFIWPTCTDELIRAELASCSQMRINLSLCLSGMQSNTATLLFLRAHIYRACVPTFYRWWKNEEHSHKQAIIFELQGFCLSSDNRWRSSN